MTLGGPRRPSLPKRDSGDRRAGDDELRHRASPGLVPAPLVGMGGAPVPADPSSYRAATEGDEPTEAHRALAAICPYLVAEDGGWRAATPMREHRCTAVRPPPPLSEETQRRLCLVEAHVTCPDYLAARQRRSAELARDRIALDQLDSLRFQPAGRASPIALERPRTAPPRPAVAGRETRSVVRSARVPIMVAVVLVVVLFGGSKFLGGTATPTTTPTVRTTASLAASPSGGASPSDAVSPTPSVDGGASPTPVVATNTYKVKRGDSLSRIAKQLGTTVAVLTQLNDLGDPPRIRIGQVLNVP